jgi:hypothetical protein
MGHRDDDFLNDERADAALRRVLARLGEPVQVAPPPDLVTGTARLLPSEPPALAARSAQRKAALRLVLRVSLFSILALVLLLGLSIALGAEPQIAMLFGDGGSGISRALLTLQLLAKPLLRTVLLVGAPFLLAGIVVVASAGWLWWWLLRRTPVYSYAESPQ